MNCEIKAIVSPYGELVGKAECNAEMHGAIVLQGSKGADGKSAYQYAVEHGYAGTEEEYGRLMGDVATVTDQVASNTKSIDNLLSITSSLYTEESSSSTDYTKSVGNIAPWGELLEIGGKSVVWNQLQPNDYVDCHWGTSSTVSGITQTVDSVGNYTLSGTTTSGYNFQFSARNKLSKGHTYVFLGINSVGVAFNLFDMTLSELISHGNTSDFIVTPSKDYNNVMFYYNTGASGTNVNAKGIFKVVDLTLMFGSGNEPTTLTDPRISLLKQYLAEHPSYNGGEIVSANTQRLDVKGANLWDEEWENGTIARATGLPVSDATSLEYCIRSKNFCEIEPNVTYLLKCNNYNEYYVGLIVYDSSYNYLDGAWTSNRPYTTPQNARYFKIMTQAKTYVYGNTYKHDIAILKGTSGTYSPYTKRIYPLPESVYPSKNLWDEQMQSGGIHPTTGTETTGANYIRSGFIPIEPNETYHVVCPVGVYYYSYDSDKAYLGSEKFVSVNGNFTTVSNAMYIRIVPQTTYGTTYNHDIAILKGTSGTYEPYHKQLHALHGIGNVYDTLDCKETVLKGYNKIDLGSLNWIADTGSPTGTFRVNSYETIPLGMLYTGKMYSREYYSDGNYSYYNVPDGCVALTNGASSPILRIRDSRFTSATDMKQHLQGTILYYEAETGGTDITTQTVTERIGKLDCSIDNWQSGTTANGVIFFQQLANSNTTDTPVIHPIFPYATTENVVNTVFWGGGYPSSNKNIIFLLPSGTTKEQFLSMVQGTTLLYELATPRTYSISGLPTEIKFEPNGTLTFANEEQLQVPNTERWLRKI